MSVVDSKFLPMSLGDIVNSLDTLRTDIDELKSASQSDGSENLEERISDIENSLNDLRSAVETLQESQEGSDDNSSVTLQNDIDDIKDAIEKFEAYEARIADLEDKVDELSSQDNSTQDSSELEDRVAALEDTHSEFFA